MSELIKPSALTQPRVAVVLLNYRGVSDTLNCLDSLRALEYDNVHIVVVDNASGDESVARLQERLDQYPGEFMLVESPQNNGYSAGNNLAVKFVLQQNDLIEEDVLKTQYVWLLNNDCTVMPRALSCLVNESLKTGGLVGSLILYPDRTYQQVGTRILWKTGGSRGYTEQELEDGMALECLSGASMLVPLMAFKRVGLLDESYFLYFEDGDFCLRAAEKNYPLTLALNSRVYHKEGATTGKHSLLTQYYFHRNRIRLIETHGDTNERTSARLYALYRLLRGSLKALLDPTRKDSARTQWLATMDALKGLSGPCPHHLGQHR
ncbi:MAG: glycosyltransferase family 2 protein [Candidatus Melainabacteria bacterium]